MSIGMSISEQSADISRLNEIYKVAVKEKVGLYEELGESVRELTVRNGRFQGNEVDACKYTCEASIIKKELE